MMQNMKEHDTALDAWQQDRTQVEPLTPDGSLRRFCRLVREDGARAVAAAPPPGDAAGLREAKAGWRIGRHLFACGVPVPEPLAFDEASGLLVCEDLGDVRLHDLVLQHGADSAEVVALYQQTVVELAKMQVLGRDNFNPAWCWDTPRYDRQLMLERESGYFLRALCRDLLQLDFDEAALAREFVLLADRAAQADASFFLHRDFQSRNIMVQEGRVRFIDYQAGRLGPLAEQRVFFSRRFVGTHCNKFYLKRSHHVDTQPTEQGYECGRAHSAGQA